MSNSSEATSAKQADEHGVPAGTGGRTGRRPGESRTREVIAEVAARQFAQHGFDRVSLRSIAAEAEVDPALVARFYGTKQQLFATVVTLPFDPAQVVRGILEGPAEDIGQRLAHFVVGVLHSPAGLERMTSLVRAATSEPEAARMVRELILRDVLDRLAAGLGVDRPQLRSSLAASQVVGVVLARHIVGLPELVALKEDDLAGLLAPTLQRYLLEPLDVS